MGKDAGDEELPGWRPEREPEPWRDDHGTGDRVARLGLQVAQGYEPAERGAEQQLGAVGPEADDAAERLEVAQQLAEARQMAAAAPRAAVTAQVEDIGRVARRAQPLAAGAPPARVTGPAVQRQYGGARRGSLIHVVDQERTVGGGERGHLGLGQ